MTLRAFAAQARHLRALRGETCVRAATGAYAWALLLDFGMLHGPDDAGYREPEKGLVVECPWRVEDPRGVVVGSADDDERIHEGVRVFLSKQVVAVTVYRPGFMARVRLTEGVTLWMFPERAADFTASSEDISVPWYLTGRAFPVGWED
jgi:hypothetical protein